VGNRARDVPAVWGTGMKSTATLAATFTIFGLTLLLALVFLLLACASTF